MVDLTPFLPGLSPVQGKAVVARFDGGRLSSEGGLLALREIERRLGLADRLASCLVDTRAPERVVHRLAEIIRFRMLMIGAGYEDGNDADALRRDPMFKLALDRLPAGDELCSQSQISRLEHLPVRGALRSHWPKVEILLRADSHYACPEVFDWCRKNRVDWIFGLAPNAALRRHVAALEKSTAARFKAAPGRGKVRRFAQFHDAAESWSRVERIIARVEVGVEGTDTRFIVTSLEGGRAKHLYQRLYCAPCQAIFAMLLDRLRPLVTCGPGRDAPAIALRPSTPAPTQAGKQTRHRGSDPSYPSHRCATKSGAPVYTARHCTLLMH